MIRFLIRRLALTIPTFIALMWVTFMLIRMVPGDPIEARRGERGITPERHAQLLHEMGLDEPPWKQFLSYANGILHGDFGTSIVSHEKVLTEFRWNSPSAPCCSRSCSACRPAFSPPSNAARSGTRA
jgi:dipeptide transport system permease protein